MKSALIRKRVQVLYVGGIHFAEGFTPNQARSILEYFLDLQLVAEVDIDIITHVAGASVELALVARLGEIIAERYNDYDGFVVIHSVDNAVYSACLLQFLFRDLGKPIVFTGTAMTSEVIPLPESNQPITPYQRMGLQTNLLTATQLATMNCSGVMLSYGPYVVRAIRAVERTTGDAKYFYTTDDTPVVDIQFGVQVHTGVPERTTAPVQFDSRFESDVTVLELRPDLRLPNPLGAALILRGYHEQIVPDNLPLPSDRPIIVDSVAPRAQNTPANIIQVHGMTNPVMITKAMVALKRSNSIAEFAELYQRNWSGEVQ